MITNKNIQVPRLHIALANDLSAHMKLSNTQISKIVQPGVFLYTGILIYSFAIEASVINVLGVFRKSTKESLKKAAENVLDFAFNKLDHKDFKFYIQSN